MNRVLSLTLIVAASTWGSSKVVWPYLEVPHKDNPLGMDSHLAYLFPKHTTVFGIPIFGGDKVTDEEFQIGASVLAEWLDNDQDGCVDTPEVLDMMLASKDIGQPYGYEWPAVPAFVFFSETEQELTNWTIPEGSLGLEGFWLAQRVFKSGWQPDCIGAAATGQPYCRDESLEEIWHGLTDHGYALAFPDVFATGYDSNSLVTKAMDKARGGKFLEIPDEYPADAWYTNPTESCDYQCQVSEYLYWVISSWVGANVGLYEDIKYQWKPYTKRLLRQTDKRIVRILKDTSTYRMPTVSPTGSYFGPNSCSSGRSHSG